MEGVTIDRRVTVNEPTLLLSFSGWSDAGAAATTAVQYVAEQTEATPFAHIDGEEFLDFTVQRPLVRLDDQRIRSLEWPGWKFLAAESANLILLTGPEPHLRWRSFCRSVLDLARQVGVARVAFLGAFLADVRYTDPVPLTGFASDTKILADLHVPPTSYQGPTGIVGTLADTFQRESIPLVSLWAAIPHYIATAANPRGALALLLRLREWIAMPIDFGTLESAAMTFQSKLLEAVESNPEFADLLRATQKPETSH